MKLTIIPPTQPTYMLELTYEELVLVGLLSYKWQICLDNNQLYKNLPQHTRDDIRRVADSCGGPFTSLEQVRKALNS